MSDKTGISWTDATWNPVRGCSRVSEGCRNCYAERQAARIVRMGASHAYGSLVRITDGGEPRWTGEVQIDAKTLALPLRWRHPRRIFVNSMSDLFHESLTNEQIAAVFGVMAAAPQHTFQVLTKRAKRMREWFSWVDNYGREVMAVEAIQWIASHDGARRSRRIELENQVAMPATWPLPNVWLGVSVENQAAADERIPELLATPAAVRFLSCEPLIGPVDLKGWGDHAPSPVTSAPESWADFAWPGWVPPHERSLIEDFWSKTNGRSPKDWLSDHRIQHVPATGARVVVDVRDGWGVTNKMATSGVDGLYLHCWNNIGRVITDDGRVVPTGGGSGSGWMNRWLTSAGGYATKLHLVISGCESGPGARPCDVAWLRSLRDQCASAGVPYFLKQARESPDTMNADITDGPGSKRKAGGVIELPYLDGVQHAAFPEELR
ncbi:MAG TPA: phage Gp37/Gp68 family protein [Pirellulaceae bacterium]|nr:phage Gp37/Gp68 family protein [Pirellulaceae bacterium]